MTNEEQPPHQAAQSLAYLLGEGDDAGFVPEEYEEEVQLALDSWSLWHEDMEATVSDERP